MPAQKDQTNWESVAGDHADDQTYLRKERDPNQAPTDEQRTQEEIEDAEQRNKEEEKTRAAANKAAGK